MFVRPIRAVASAVLFSLCIGGAVLAANQVFTVSSLSIDRDFAELQAAIQAAQEGDVLIVKGGPYLPATIDGKSLTIVCEPIFSSFHDFPKLVVKNLSAAQHVVVRGRFEIHHSVTTAIEVRDCAGPVEIEDVTIDTTINELGPTVWPQVLVVNSASVTLARCSVHGKDGRTDFAPDGEPSPALRVENSNVAAYGCWLTGGGGMNAGVPPFLTQVFPSQAGAACIELASGTLLVAGSTVIGGRGGWGYFDGANCFASGDGGAGIVVGGLLRVLGSNVVAGLAGVDPGSCPHGSSAPPAIVSAGGTIVNVPQALRGFQVSPLGKPGATVVTRFDGVPGEAALLIVSLAPSGAFVPSLAGALLPGGSLIVFPLAIPGSGTLSLQTPLSSGLLPPAIEGISLYEQAAFSGIGGGGVLSGPSVITLLNDGAGFTGF